MSRTARPIPRRIRAFVGGGYDQGVPAARIKVTERLLDEVLGGGRPEFMVRLKEPVEVGAQLSLRLMFGDEERASILAEVVSGGETPGQHTRLRVVALVPISGVHSTAHLTPVEAQPVAPPPLPSPSPAPALPDGVVVHLGERTVNNVYIVRSRPEAPGVFIAQDEALPPVGERLTLDLRIETMRPHVCEGRVAWTSEFAGMTAAPGYGVELLSPPPWLVDELLALARRRDPVVREDD